MSRLVRVGLAAVISWYAGLAFAPVFGAFPGPGAFLLAISATVGGAVAVTALALAIRRIGPGVTTAVGGCLLVVVIAAAVSRAGVDLVHGPWGLLTSALPADAAGPPLAAVSIVVGWAALASTLPAAVRTGPALVLLAPAVVVVAALGLGASASPLPAWYAAGAVALVTVLLVSSSPSLARSRSLPRLRRAWPALLIAGAGVAAAVLLGPVAPGSGARPPTDARALVAAPVQPRSGVSPLQQYLALRDGTIPLKLTGTVSPPGGALRMATLTQFDGTYWTVGGDFRLAGRTLPPDPIHAGAGAESVRQQVTVAAGDLDWLVTAGRPAAVSVPGLGVDQATGNVAVPVDGTPPRQYSATSTASPVTVEQLLTAQPSPLSEPAPPPLPPAVNSFLRTTVADEPDGLDQILALSRRLRSGGEFRYDQAQEVAGGHGYFQIARLLDTRRGTSEQYASAFAVMVRALGYDARVVLGFLPAYDGSAFVASGRDVAAWVEVRFDRLGWVSVDPSPRGNPIGSRPDAPGTAGRAASAPDPLAGVPAPGATYPPDAARPPSIGDGTGAIAPSGPTWVIVAGSALGVVLVAAIAPTVRTLRRTRRRRAPSPRLAVLGAWWETVALLRRLGAPVGPAQTTGEVAHAAPELGPLVELAAIVDEAAFAPDQAAPELRTRAWSAEADIRRQARAGLTRRRRLGLFLDPRF